MTYDIANKGLKFQKKNLMVYHCSQALFSWHQFILILTLIFLEYLWISGYHESLSLSYNKETMAMMHGTKRSLTKESDHQEWFATLGARMEHLVRAIMNHDVLCLLGNSNVCFLLLVQTLYWCLLVWAKTLQECLFSFLFG